MVSADQRLRFLSVRRREKLLRYLSSIMKTPGFKMLPVVFL